VPTDIPEKEGDAERKKLCRCSDAEQNDDHGSPGKRFLRCKKGAAGNGGGRSRRKNEIERNKTKKGDAGKLN